MALEISRRRLGWAVVKLGLGAMLVLGAVAVWSEPAPPELRDDVVYQIFPFVMLVTGAVPVLSNGWLLIRRPIVLRATDDGVWFGAGPVIPWRDVAYVYESGIFWQKYGHSGRTISVSFSFHRARTMFKLPPFLWCTTWRFGDVRISAADAEDPPQVLVARLGHLVRSSSAELADLPEARIRVR